MPDYLPLFRPGAAVTYTASAPVTGGQLLAVTGDRTVAPAAAGSHAIGVAAFDGGAGDLITASAGGVHRLAASATITAGDRLTTAAGGAVAPLTDPATQPVVGVALTGATVGGHVTVLAR